MSCGVGGRLGWDPVLLWLWCRPPAVALIQPLAWESPYAADVALKNKPTKNFTFKFLEVIGKMQEALGGAWSYRII